ncbi:minor capsid protein [Streptococcus suis]|uniref:minor capsid protein n=1 Tax=Streptococcus suis TaxID=1307 RepID=UPI001EDF3480|nr:minor capsid protein [Streptococcus suis]
MSDKQIRNNQRYNAERQAQAELMKRDLDRDKVLAQIYQESFDRMQREIDGFYIRYASREGLTKQEAMKKASEMDVTKFADKAAKAVKEKDFSHATNEWLKVYNLKMKVSRLELLKAELTLEIQNLTAEVNEIFDKARTDEYLNEYKRQAGILGISSSGAKKRMQAILDADFYGQKFSARVWGGLGLRATLQRDVFGSLNRIFTDMMGYKQEMKRLAKKYGTSEQNAKRLLKTEIARINADTQYDMLKDNGFTHLIYVAEPGACEVCQALDGVAIPIDKVEKGVNFYPMHPNCRCSAYGHIKMDYKAGGSTLDGYELWNASIEAEDEKVYNQDMFTLDLMAKQRSFTVGNDIRVKTKKLNGTDFDFWAQDNTKKIRDTVFNVQSSLNELKDYPVPTIVFLKKSRLPGFAGYDYKQDILFVSDMLHSEKEFAKILSDNYFAAQNIKDTMVHELTHKKHWDSAKAFYKANKKRYNNVEQAMSELNSPLVSYVKEQLKHDYNYLYHISDNAAIAFYNDNINELVAEVGVLGDKITDPNLLNKVKEVLSWK